MATTIYWHTDSHVYDVIVIGAGIAGLSASRELARRDIDHLVLERGTIGCGASTRNAGFLMRGAADNYAGACRDFGRDTAAALWRWAEQSLSLLRDAGIERLNSYQPRSSCLLAIDQSEAEELEQSRDMLIEDGFGVQWLTGGSDSAWQSGLALAGLVNPSDAVCNPAELIRWLAEPVFAKVRQGVDVMGLDLDGSSIRIGSNAGEFRAEKVLICTNAYAGSLVPSLAGQITPRRGQMLALDAPGVRLDHAYYINHGHEYIREAGNGVIIVGGCRGIFADEEIGVADHTTDNVQGAIETFAARILEKRYPVITRWAGTMGFTANALPVITPIPALGKRAWFCGGFTGHGMSLAHKTAHAGVAQMLDGTSSLFSQPVS